MVKLVGQVEALVLRVLFQQPELPELEIRRQRPLLKELAVVLLFGQVLHFVVGMVVAVVLLVAVVLHLRLPQALEVLGVLHSKAHLMLPLTVEQGLEELHQQGTFLVEALDMLLHLRQ
jgi:hypothetical protein